MVQIHSLTMSDSIQMRIRSSTSERMRWKHHQTVKTIITLLHSKRMNQGWLLWMKRALWLNVKAHFIEKKRRTQQQLLSLRRPTQWKNLFTASSNPVVLDQGRSNVSKPSLALLIFHELNQKWNATHNLHNQHAHLNVLDLVTDQCLHCLRSQRRRRMLSWRRRSSRGVDQDRRRG